MPRRSGLFDGFLLEHDEQAPGGWRRRRVRREELAEAYRLIREHRDVYAGRPRSRGVDPGLAFGQRMPLG